MRVSWRRALAVGRESGEGTRAATSDTADPSWWRMKRMRDKGIPSKGILYASWRRALTSVVS